MDIDLSELDQFLPTEERVRSPNEIQIRQAAEHILKNSPGVISTLFLRKEIDVDAANFLVEECLLLFTDDLFEDRDYVDPEGYVKYMPDSVDMIFFSSLLKYNIDPTTYSEKLTLPKIWKNRLSANGMELLRSMEFYRKILDSNAPSEPSSDEESSKCKY